MADPKAKEVTSGLTEADLTKIAQIAATAAGTVVKEAMSGMQRTQAIRDHAAAIGPQASALARTLIDNDAISADDGIAMLDAAFGKAAAPKTKAKAGKGKQKAAARVEDDDDDDDLEDDDGEEDDDADDDAEDEDDDGEEEARAARKGKDRVNHFGRAMAKSKQPKVGGGRTNGGEEDGGRAKVNPLLADHAKVTGADWSAKAASKAH